MFFSSCHFLSGSKPYFYNMQHLLLQAAGGASNPIFTFLPFILILIVFYFFMIRPQQKRAKEEEAFRKSLAKGDKVTTIGGLYGKIVVIDDTTVVLEVESNARIRFDKSAIRALPGEAAATPEVKA